MTQNKYYVYVHISTIDDIPFYVGFGHGVRCKVKSKRSDEWKLIASNGYRIELLCDKLSISHANIFEKLYIRIFRKVGFPLVNKINGGTGNTTRREELLRLREKDYHK